MMTIIYRFIKQLCRLDGVTSKFPVLDPSAGPKPNVRLAGVTLRDTLISIMSEVSPSAGDI